MRAILLASCLLMGCLVTEKKEFPPEPNCPPSVETATLETTPPRPLGSVIQLDLAEEGGDAGAADRDLLFEVQVRDCNAEQDLEAWISLNGNPVATEMIPAESRNPFSFIVGRNLFTGASGPGTCNRLELRVSGQFRFGLDGRPADPADLGTATWWIAVIDSNDPERNTVEMVGCL